MKARAMLIGLLALGLLAGAARAESPPEQQARLRWWQEARFGMFIHWGVYSIPARGEWVMYQEKIPAEEYAKFAQQFSPRQYRPREWAALAREAGMRYMVMTSRHHDGFSLFDSKVSDYTAAKTAAQRDLLAEYVQAARRAGLRVGCYYSLLDWRWPAYWAGPEKDAAGWGKLLDYVHSQVRELCSNYGRLDILWYDGGWPYDAKAWRSAELNAMVRKLQPQVIINDRSQLREDFGTPEQVIGEYQGDRPWESCMTMNDHWGYCADDHNWKTPATLIQNLARCVSGGGNYLLNVGPKPDGTIPEESVRLLREVGGWMRVNGRAIYGCGRAPFGAGKWGVTTARRKTVYLHLLRWPGRVLCLYQVTAPVRSARMLAGGRPVPFRLYQGRLYLRELPAQAPDPRDTVIELELE